MQMHCLKANRITDDTSITTLHAETLFVLVISSNMCKPCWQHSQHILRRCVCYVMYECVIYYLPLLYA